MEWNLLAVERITNGSSPLPSDARPVGSVPGCWARRTGEILVADEGGQVERALQKTNANGYLYLCLKQADGKKKMRLAHRLVLEAFVGPCPQGQEACHRDGNAANNELSNLRWDTHLANCQDRDERRALSSEQAKQAKDLRADEGLFYREIGKCRGVCGATAWAAVRGLRGY